jgi:hypothetical protein
MFEALEALEAALAAAPPIPLTDSVRVVPSELQPLVEEVRAAALTSEASDQAEELARVVLRDRSVPLTGQRRVDLKRAQGLIASLRSSI